MQSGELNLDSELKKALDTSLYLSACEFCKSCMNEGTQYCYICFFENNYMCEPIYYEAVNDFIVFNEAKAYFNDYGD